MYVCDRQHHDLFYLQYYVLHDKDFKGSHITFCTLLWILCVVNDPSR